MPYHQALSLRACEWIPSADPGSRGARSTGVSQRRACSEYAGSGLFGARYRLSGNPPLNNRRDFLRTAPQRAPGGPLR